MSLLVICLEAKIFVQFRDAKRFIKQQTWNKFIEIQRFTSGKEFLELIYLPEEDRESFEMESFRPLTISFEFSISWIDNWHESPD